MSKLYWWTRERIEELLTWLLYKIDPQQKRKDEE